MAKISVSSIALVLVWMVCIATQDTQQQAEFERRVESLEKQLIELASFSKIPGTFVNLYFWSRHNITNELKLWQKATITNF